MDVGSMSETRPKLDKMLTMLLQTLQSMCQESPELVLYLFDFREGGYSIQSGDSEKSSRSLNLTFYKRADGSLRFMLLVQIYGQPANDLLAELKSCIKSARRTNG